MWHVTRDTWIVTCDTFGGVNILSKFQLPSSYRLWFMILWRSGGKGSVAELMNELTTKLFIEQHGYTGSVKKSADFLKWSEICQGSDKFD